MRENTIRVLFAKEDTQKAARQSRPASRKRMPPGPNIGITNIRSRQPRPAPHRSAKYRLLISVA